MKGILVCVLLVLAAACGKKEWPQPIVDDEMITVDHLEARMDQSCLLINAKLGGKLVNLEYFLIEIEKDGCPTCPFTPTIVRKAYPFGKTVYRRENSFIFTLCQPIDAQVIRIRLKADNTHHIIAPALSKIVTLKMPQ